MSVTNNKFVPSIEALESRATPSITSVDLTNGVLTIECDDYDDSVGVYTANGMAVVEDYAPNGFYLTTPKWSFKPSKVKRIEFYGNGGHDYFDNDVYKPVVAFGGAGDDYLDGGNHHDELYGGSGIDTLIGRDGNDELYGGSGDDYLSGMKGKDYFSGGGDFDTYKDDFKLTTPVVGGAKITDVRQGGADSCVINGAMAATALSGVKWASKISYLGGDNYQVRLWINGSESWYHVDFDGTWTDSDSQPTHDNGYTHGDFWNVLGQRAYLSSFGIDYTQPADTWDDSTTAWQNSNNALKRLTNWNTTWTDIWSASPSDIKAARAKNASVIAITFDNVNHPELTGWHTYTITSVKFTKGDWIVKLRNPWATGGDADDGNLELRWSEFTANFKGIGIATPK